MLVLEHDTAIRRFVAAVLRLAGHEVVEFALAGDTVDWLATHRAAAVICDHNPPDMAGGKFVRILRSRIDTGGVPILVLLSEHTLACKLGALDSGANAYVLKPVDGEVLVARLQAAMRPRGAGYEAELEAELAGEDYA